VTDDPSGWQESYAATTLAGDNILQLEPEVLAVADSEGTEAALTWQQE